MIGEVCASTFYGLLGAFVGLVLSAAVLALVPALEPLEWLGAGAAGAGVFVVTFRASRRGESIQEGGR